MLSKLISGAIVGLGWVIVEVEVGIPLGLPALTIVLT